ncbi:MAG: urate hydroxylase PuuD [Deltaproteobacteria bacterium]|nr:urate hydroxylase PuuD [Deltaproteobacteria bacterium]
MFASILARSDWEGNLELLLRWLHVIAGIIWIGHLYFFNFVNANFQAKIEKDVKQKVNPQLLPRALFWFRWGAMLTLIMGLALFTLLYMYKGDGKFGPSALWKFNDKITDRAIWIMIGMTCGIIMWFNVWFIIWPRQQKIIRAVRDGKAPDAAMVKMAGNASKLNTYLSAPMLFGMLAPGHYSSINPVTAIIAVVLALATFFHLFMVAPKVGTDIGND